MKTPHKHSTTAKLFCTQRNDHTIRTHASPNNSEGKQVSEQEKSKENGVRKEEIEQRAIGDSEQVLILNPRYSGLTIQSDVDPQHQVTPHFLETLKMDQDGSPIPPAAKLQKSDDEVHNESSSNTDKLGSSGKLKDLNKFIDSKIEQPNVKAMKSKIIHIDEISSESILTSNNK